ncbi:immunity protein 26 of polymorphic toxin system [Chitinophaga polysaccharea]|uniref:Immunity protein 26 of polymorphic toxin system n=1 Tax=Chitinophaga polysaccharea TaxID=1293035 RepID=A0A561PW49_9BACT|nr:Imm26 family immunity protein [Chitinophaga polysaccharea]TWF42341.1 immunity protein 26 of polymorphic toxin system [Chitinophaga polysaccharea]
MPEFSNEQRKYIGLCPVDPQWTRITFPKGLICYFDQDIIRKALIQTVTSYAEFDTAITTRERSKIISPGGKGKEKPISVINISSYPGRTVSFGVDISPVDPLPEMAGNGERPPAYQTYWSWKIGSQKADIENNAPVFNGMQQLADFWQRLPQFIQGLPADHLDRLAQLKEKKAGKIRPVKFRSGDFFAVPTRFSLYGDPVEYVFGRHLLNISALRKREVVDKDHHWYDLMTVVQLVTLYDFRADSLVVDLLLLQQQKTLPAFYMMDDTLMRGQYPIIGHLPLEPAELNFPMHYGRYVASARKGYYFGWGHAMVTDIPPIAITVPEGVDLNIDFRNNGVSCGAPIDLLADFRNGLPPFYKYTDINHPDNLAIKTALFNSLAVPVNISYDDFCRQFGAKNREELLTLS